MIGCANSEKINGFWSGSMDMNGKTIDISFDLNAKDKLFSSYDWMLLDQPISNLTIKNKTISFSVLDAEVVFNGTISGKKITGKTKINGLPSDVEITFSVTKQAVKPVKPYSVENVIIKSNNISLSAEIYKPHSKGLHSAIVLLHGSSTNLKSDYIFYADFFANLGFEVLVFDKRGNGESTGNYATSSHSNLEDDAIACLETMKNRESVDERKIGLWGFSQGAMLSPKIVSKTNIPKFLIAKAPEIINVTEAAAFSDSLRVVNSGGSELNGQIAAESHRKVGEIIRNRSDYKAVENFINLNALNYSFMNQTGLYGNISIDKNDFEGYYWKGREDNFYSYWKNLKIPTLVIFGSDDEYVNALKNESILKRLNNPKIEIKLFPRANHALKKTFNPAKYHDLDWPRVIEGYTDYVKKWIKNEVEK